MHISHPSAPPMASVITNDSKSQLKAELAQREEELFKAVDYGQQLLEEKEALVEELEKMKLKCEEAEGRYASQRISYDKSLQFLQQTTSDQMRELEEELERKDDNLKGLENKLKGELKSFEFLSEENAKNVEDLRKLELELEKNKKSSKAMLDDSEAMVKNLQEQIVQLQEINEETLSELKEQKEEERTLRMEYTDLLEDHQKLREELNMTQQACFQWHSEYKEQLEQTKVLTESLNDQASLILTKKIPEIEPLSEEMKSLFSDCERCSILQEDVERLQSDYTELNDQLMKVVQQKYELQQQLEDWQSDMERLIGRQLERYYKKE